MDTLGFSFRTVLPRRDPGCPVCGEDPTIDALIDYEWFCTTGEVRRADESQDVPNEPGASLSQRAYVTAPGGASFIPVLTPAELSEALEGPRAPLLVDVREDWEWAVSSLAEQGAIHLPLKELESRMDVLPRDRDLVLYCRSGARSDRGARLLRDAGFSRVGNLRGGLERWAADLAPGLPVA